MTGRNGTISEVKTGLKRCGYSDPLLRENYIYEDGTGEHIIPLAGFARPVYDSRTACISVTTYDGSGEITRDYVNRFRGLGAPLVFVCCNGTMQWWTIGTGGAERKQTVSSETVRNFFDRHKGDFAPERIWRAKNLGRVAKDQQLSFVDIGLTPLLEHEMGDRLGGLMKRVVDSLRNGFTVRQLTQGENQRWIFRAAFWLLCAKILQDKGVKNFTQLDLNDVDAVLEAVTTHYGAQQQVQVGARRQRQAFEGAASEIKTFGSLSNLTTEAFGYMYENVLVDKTLRSALGIHATPSYLVDYIVWELWPWIEQIPEYKRVVFEPACGHAPFLTGAMRLLRELYMGEGKAFHTYAKRRLIGIETDSFAREIARLSLTMADIPNPNGWKTVERDIFRTDVLSQKAKNATILLCNPPFENFSPDEQNAYKAEGQQLRCFNKAAEMLWRTLPNMPEGSVFGVVLPRGFLHKRNLAKLRKMIIGDFELHQICSLPKKVFRYGNHESVVLTGRKKVGGSQKDGVGKNSVLCRHIPKEGLSRFQEKYEGRDQYIPQSRFFDKENYDLRVLELEDVWEYCERNFPKLGSISKGGQGLIYKGRDLPEGAKTFDKKRFAGAVKGYALFGRDIPLHGLPEEYWMNLAPEVIRRPMWGLETGRDQILMNYAPVSADQWRLKALIDREGLPVRGRFLVFRLESRDWPLNALWAVVNSPLVNAFIYAHTTDRDITAGTARGIPVPVCCRESLEKLKGLVAEYFTLMEKKDSEFGIDVQDAAKRLLLSIDAEVMRLYDLPPRMEKRVLDLFQGVQRKGVDFEFTGYYPEGFESAIPLHEYLSEEYQRSTVSFVKKWVDDNRSPEIIKALEKAVEVFQGD